MIGPAGTRRRVTLVRYPGPSLAEARRKAAAASDDPISIPVARKESRYGTVKELFGYVLEAMKAEGKGCEPNRLYLRDGPLAAMNHLGPATLARNVRPSDVSAWLREVHKAGVKLQHPRAYLSAAFCRAMKADNDPTAEVGSLLFGIDANPVLNVGGRSGVVPRDRKLSLDELKIFWREFPKHTQAQTASAARMIIAMGGLRVLEILGSWKSWWTNGDNPQLALPKTKNATAHVLPLTQAAERELKFALESADPESEFLYQYYMWPTEPMPANALAQAVRQLRRVHAPRAPSQPGKQRRKFSLKMRQFSGGQVAIP